MKLKFLGSLFVLLVVAVFDIQAAEEPKAAPAETAVSSVKAELAAVIAKVQAKAQAGEVTEVALADELKALDQILAAHKAEKNDDVAQVLVMKGALYLQ